SHSASPAKSMTPMPSPMPPLSMCRAPSITRGNCCASSAAASGTGRVKLCGATMTVISTVEQLEAIYGFPNDASTVKVADRVTPPYRILIEKSPFAALATSGPEGLDCSPRGDLAGFVRIHDDRTLMMPDRRGNNRIDSLRNIVRDPRVALLVLIHGSGTAVRVTVSATRECE